MNIDALLEKNIVPDTAIRFGIRRLLLACVELEFTHPVSGVVLKVKAPLASGFQELIDKLGWGESLD